MTQGVVAEHALGEQILQRRKAYNSSSIRQAGRTHVVVLLDETRVHVRVDELAMSRQVVEKLRVCGESDDLRDETQFIKH